MLLNHLHHIISIDSSAASGINDNRDRSRRSLLDDYPRRSRRSTDLAHLRPSAPMATRTPDDDFLLADDGATAAIAAKATDQTDEQPADEEKASDGTEGDTDDGAWVRTVIKARVDGRDCNDATWLLPFRKTVWVEVERV